MKSRIIVYIQIVKQNFGAALSKCSECLFKDRRKERVDLISRVAILRTSFLDPAVRWRSSHGRMLFGFYQEATPALISSMKGNLDLFMQMECFKPVSLKIGMKSKS